MQRGDNRKRRGFKGRNFHRKPSREAIAKYEQKLIDEADLTVDNLDSILYHKNPFCNQLESFIPAKPPIVIHHKKRFKPDYQNKDVIPEEIESNPTEIEAIEAIKESSPDESTEITETPKVAEKTQLDSDFESTTMNENKSIAKSFMIKICQEILEKCPPESSNLGFDVYNGLAGIAFTFHKLHTLDKEIQINNKSALCWAELYINSALLKTVDSEYESSFMKSSVGVHAISYLISKSESDLNKILDAESITKRNLSHPELYHGNAGYLYTLLKLPEIDNKIATLLAKRILQEGKRGKERRFTKVSDRDTSLIPEKVRGMPLHWSWFLERHVGAAHGLAGILTVLTQFAISFKKNELDADQTVFIEDLEAGIRFSIEFITADMRTFNGNYALRVDDCTGRCSQLYSGTELVQFCSGVTGVGLMLCKSLELEKSDLNLKFAKDAGEVVWQRGILLKGDGLCHGTCGNAYLFLALFKATGEYIYFSRAVKFMKNVLERWNGNTDNGLMEGNAGIACFLMDLIYYDKDDFKGFPLFSDL